MIRTRVRVGARVYWGSLGCYYNILLIVQFSPINFSFHSNIAVTYIYHHYSHTSKVSFNFNYSFLVQYLFLSMTVFCLNEIKHFVLHLKEIFCNTSFTKFLFCNQTLIFFPKWLRFVVLLSFFICLNHRTMFIQM